MKRMLGFRKMSLLLACLTIFAVILLVSSDTLPALSQDPSGLITIESNDSLVGQTGIWTIQNAAEASGGSYLYSNGNEDDALTLEFYGSIIEITYVSHPTFGSFAIEVDNTILRTVVATSEETTFGQQAVIDYLENEPHTLRVFGVNGVVAIDAFTTQLPAPTQVTESAEVGFPESLTCNPDTFPVRASVGDGDTDTNGTSTQVSMSGDGRYVAFASTASNLLASGLDTNGASDVFVFDRLLCIMTRVSVTSSGGQVTGGASTNPSISQDGRYVAFQSTANGLVASDNDGLSDIFVHDRQTGITSIVSVSTGGAIANNQASNPDISSDGQRIVFESLATNLVASDTNNAADIFLRDFATSTTTRVSLTNTGTQSSTGGHSNNAAISGNGQFVAFESIANNLVTGDINDLFDIFVRDLTGNTTTRVSLINGGGEITDEDSLMPDISNDGRYVVFESRSEDIVPNILNERIDIFVRDRTGGTTSRVSVSSAGVEGNDDSNGASISGNGRYVAFYSAASTLVAGDSAGTVDIFVRDITSTSIMRASLLNNGSDPNPLFGDPISLSPSLSDSGRNVAFESYADLTSDNSDQNSPAEDIYVADIPFNLAPSDLIATALSDDEIALHWNDNTSDETGFELQQSPNGVSGWFTFQSIAPNFRDWTDTNLNCETTYYYRLLATRSGGNTDYSNVSTAKTLLCPMSPPSNFQITATGQSNVDLSWVDESGTETEFRIDYKIGTDDWNDPEFPIATVEPNVVSFRLSGLSCAENYTFRVRAYRASDGNLTIPSNEDSTTTLICTEPGATSLIAPEGNSAIGIPEFQFTEPRLVTHVNIQVRDDNTNALLKNEWYEMFTQAPCSGGVCSVIDPLKLSLGEGQYNWCILTYYQPTNTVYGGVFNVCFTGTKQFSIVPPRPTSPIDIVVNSFVDIPFVWDESPGITYYKLEVTTSTGASVINQWFEAGPICNGVSCTVIIPNRFPSNGLYYWRIRGWNSNGYGPYSNPWVTFTINVGMPGLAQDLTVQTNGSGVPIAFEWTKDGNVSWYAVYVSGIGGVWINQWSAADTICSGTTCSFPTSLPFSDGSYSWWVGAYSPSGSTSWSQLVFVVTITDPAIPGNLAITANPVGYPPTELSWNDDANTTWFNVFIQDQYDIVWHNAWYEKGNSILSCSAGICHLPINIAFTDRDYNWWVRAYGPGGTSLFSPEADFDVTVGLPITPTGLNETTDANGVPTILLWTDDPKATWYNVVIRDQFEGVWLNAWYQKGGSALSCGGFCQVPVSLAFVDRNYSWWVLAYGPGGSSPWSAKRDFTVGVGAPGEPSGLQTTVGLQSITFQWTDDTKATWYNLFVRDQFFNTWVNIWYQKGNSALSCSGTCSITINMPFWEVNYTWSVQAYGPGGSNWKDTPENFTVSYTDGVTPVGLAESIDVATGMPSALTWSKDPNTTWYQVYLNGASGSNAGIWLNKWYEASTICPTNCSVSVSDLPFLAGNYEWLVNGYAPGGGAGWSGKATFSITSVTLAAPLLQLPADNAFFAGPNVSFQWTSVGQANWYQIEIKGSNGQVYTSLWFPSSACNVGVCTGSGVLSNELLINGTWRVRGYRNIGAIYGNWSVSRKINILN